MTASAITTKLGDCIQRILLTAANNPLSDRESLPATGNVGKEVIALVVDDDECREVDHIDLPHRLHAELGIFEHRHALDAVLREPRGRPADRAQVKSAV